MYKLIRMEQAELTDEPFAGEHGDAEQILREHEQGAAPPCTELLVRCRARSKARVVEYLNGSVIRTCENGDLEMKLYVMEKEQHWFGMILSFGDELEILEPERLRVRVLETAERLTALYRK